MPGGVESQPVWLWLLSTGVTVGVTLSVFVVMVIVGVFGRACACGASGAIT
jgi:heme/copper-type cytochrome/quinol oxidase subunit 2